MKIYIIFLFLLILLINFMKYFKFQIKEKLENYDRSQYKICDKYCYKAINCAHPDKYKKKNCPYRFYKRWTTCPNKPNEKCLECPHIRPNLLLPGYDDDCCHTKCKKQSKYIGKPYYCKVYGRCYKKYAKTPEDMWCGYHTMSDTKAKIYDTEEKCKADINPYVGYNKDKCLNTPGVGWCTDYRGIGSCVPGTPQGPIDQVKYFYCYVNQTGNRNSYTSGYLDPNYVLSNMLI